MARILTRNHEHYARAIRRLPLGVASNFRFWGEGRTIYVKVGRGASNTLPPSIFVPCTLPALPETPSSYSARS